MTDKPIELGHRLITLCILCDCESFANALFFELILSYGALSVLSGFFIDVARFVIVGRKAGSCHPTL